MESTEHVIGVRFPDGNWSIVMAAFYLDRDGFTLYPDEFEYKQCRFKFLKLTDSGNVLYQGIAD